MSLLFDANLSPHLVRRFEDLFPNSEHVCEVGLADATDREVWAFARLHGFALVSLDADFLPLTARLGAPPKVLWLRLGLATTTRVEAVLRARYERIVAFLRHDPGPALIVEPP